MDIDRSPWSDILTKEQLEHIKNRPKLDITLPEGDNLPKCIMFWPDFDKYKNNTNTNSTSKSN